MTSVLLDSVKSTGQLEISSLGIFVLKFKMYAHTCFACSYVSLYLPNLRVWISEEKGGYMHGGKFGANCMMCLPPTGLVQ